VNDDRDFLRAILADPVDNALRLVYADWLEERGDPRAEYLRLQAELTGVEPRDRRRAMLEDRRLEIHVAVDPRRYLSWLEQIGGSRAECEAIDDALLDMERADLRRGDMRVRLDELRRQTDPGWQALLDRPPVENCEVRFKFRCPKQWQNLARTDDSQVRFCAGCRKNVYYCVTIAEARNHASRGHCVAVNSGQQRSRGDLEHDSGDFFDVDMTSSDDQRSAAGALEEDECFLGLLIDTPEDDKSLLGMVLTDEGDALDKRRPWWKFW